MKTLPERIKLLAVSVNSAPCGDLIHESQIVFKYRHDDPAQPSVGLLMPPARLVYQTNSLFPVMDQNLPEGYLFQRLREMFPKQPLTAMHLLALIGDNGIGRLGFHLESDRTPPSPAAPISRQTLLNTGFTPAVFDDLVQAYLLTGLGISGMQPKIMVPDRASIPTPNLIVKAGSQSYPGLAANEFLCLSAARASGIAVPRFDLSNDGQILVIDRFDIEPDGRRRGFEDIASLMGLCVRDTLSDRKYQGSYQSVADALRAIGLPAADMQRFYEQVALSIMVRNGDGHLKNYGVCYDEERGPGLSPMFDVVTTAIYRYARLNGGPDLEDKTMALKLFRGKGQSRMYPSTAELLRFGREVCGVVRPADTIVRIADGLSQTRDAARTDERIPTSTLQQMAQMWEHGQQHARDAAGVHA